MPKGAPTAPELIARCAERGARRRAEGVRGADRDAARAVKPGDRAAASIRRSATCRTDEYGALMAKHTDHHFRQFGV